MAIIVLSPNESFEHYHQGSTISALVEGQATITIGDAISEMEVGEELTIPSGVRHVMHNTGKTNAKIMCCGH